MEKECSYGCGNPANFLFANGKYCCSDSCNSCPEVRRKSLHREKTTCKYCGKIVSFSGIKTHENKCSKPKKVRTCPDCGSSFDFRQKKCTACNTSSKCRNCGKPLPKGRSFCSNTCQGEHKVKESNETISSGKAVSQASLRRYFLRTRENKCSICGQHEWTGRPIPLVLDHIDGISDNNIESNLRLVCCNCDALLSTYKGKNRGNGRYSRKTRYKEGKSY